MRHKKYHEEEAESSFDREMSDAQEDVLRGPEGSGVKDRFIGRFMIDINEAIFRIICSIHVMNDYEKAEAYHFICGSRLRYIGHSVWEITTEEAPAFPPETPGEFLALTDTANSDKSWRDRLTHHELFDSMIEELEEMDMDTLARTYHRFCGYKVEACRGDDDRVFFVTFKEDQP